MKSIKILLLIIILSSSVYIDSIFAAGEQPPPLTPEAPVKTEPAPTPPPTISPAEKQKVLQAYREWLQANHKPLVDTNKEIDKIIKELNPSIDEFLQTLRVAKALDPELVIPPYGSLTKVQNIPSTIAFKRARENAIKAYHNFNRKYWEVKRNLNNLIKKRNEIEKSYSKFSDERAKEKYVLPQPGELTEIIKDLDKQGHVYIEHFNNLGPTYSVKDFKSDLAKQFLPIEFTEADAEYIKEAYSQATAKILLSPVEASKTALDLINKLQSVYESKDIYSFMKLVADDFGYFSSAGELLITKPKLEEGIKFDFDTIDKLSISLRIHESNILSDGILKVKVKWSKYGLFKFIQKENTFAETNKDAIFYFKEEDGKWLLTKLEGDLMFGVTKAIVTVSPRGGIDYQEQAIESLIKLETAYENKDLPVLQSLIAPDFSWVDPNDSAGIPRANLLTAIQGDFNKLSNIRFNDVKINSNFCTVDQIDLTAMEITLKLNWERSAITIADGKEWSTHGTSYLKFKYYEGLAGEKGIMKLVKIFNELDRDSNKVNLMLGLTNQENYISINTGRLEGGAVGETTRKVTEGGQISTLIISSILPSSGNNDESSLSIKVRGTNFSTTGTVTIKLIKSGQTDIAATNVNVSSISQTETEITATLNLSGATASVWDVVVVNPDGQSATLSSGFTINAATYPTPTITSINPTSETQGSAPAVTITGTNFRNGATVKLTKSGENDISGGSVNIASSTQITCTFNLSNATTGSWNVVVTNSDGQSATLSSGFTVAVQVSTAPQITSLDYNYGAAEDRIIISGTNFGNSQGSSTVTIGGSAATIYSWSNTAFTIGVPSGLTAGASTLTVTVNNQTASTSFGILKSGKDVNLAWDEYFDFETATIGSSGDIFTRDTGQPDSRYIGVVGGIFQDPITAGIKDMGSYSTLQAAGNPDAFTVTSYSGSTNLSNTAGKVFTIYTRNGKYAKIRITSLPSSGALVIFDWVYQTDGTKNFR